MRTGIYGALSLLGGYVVFKKSSPSGVQVIRDYPHKVRQVVTIFATKKKKLLLSIGFWLFSRSVLTMGSIIPYTT